MSREQKRKEVGLQDSAQLQKSDPTDMRVLQAATEASSLESLAATTGIPRSTVHRHLLSLVENGSMLKIGHAYRVSQAGQELGGRRRVSKLPPPHLDDQWPWLRLFPTPVHRAAAILVLVLMIARRDNLVEDMHVSLILCGPTQRLKSWLVKVCCWLIGVDPGNCEVSMMQTRGRGLLRRLDGRGETVYQCEALKQPILWCNELSRGDPQVKRDVMAIMHGRKQFKIENDQIVVEGVPLFEMNFLKKEGDLEQKLGFDAAMLRRAVTVDFTRVPVSTDVRAESKELAEKLKAVGPIKLPKAPQTPLSSECHRLIEQACEQCILAESRDFTDSGRIITAILGARALLSDRKATELVLYCWFLVFETTGFVNPEWRAQLALLFSSGPDKPGTSGLERVKPASVAPEKKSSAVAPAQSVADENEFDLDANLTRTKDLLEQAGLRITDDTELIRPLLASVVELQHGRWDRGYLLAFLQRLPVLQKWDELLRKAAISAEDMAALSVLAVDLREKGWVTDDLVEALEVLDHLNAFDLNGKAAAALFRELRGAMDAGGARWREFLLEAAQQGVDIRERRNQLLNEVTSLESKIAELDDARRGVEDRLAQLKDRLERSAQLDEEQQRNLQVFSERMAQLKNAVKHWRCRTLAGPILELLLFDTRVPLDRELSSLVSEFLLYRECADEDSANRNLHIIIGRAQERLLQMRFQDPALEGKRTEMLKLLDEDLSGSALDGAQSETTA
ncbi:MAG TPA: helix-turn-helix domain-containing protein [Planctomycetota bacterium]|jgi:biotin operon repressor